MRRAAVILALSAAILVASWPASAAERPKMLNGIAMIDYSTPPHWKVGDWVRYKFAAGSEKGKRDDYTTTILIGGEEDFWGERCFWLETWTEAPGVPRAAVATLVSYSVFEDSLASARTQVYVRKTITGATEDGLPDEQLYLRAPESLRRRATPNDDTFRHIDSLGVDTVTVTKGHYTCRKVLNTYYVKASAQNGDSSFVDEITEKRTSFFNNDVPITHMVRQDIEVGTTRKTWFIGQSQSAAAKVLDRGKGSADLIGFGHGETARMLPKERQKSFAEQKAVPTRPPASRTRAGAKKAG